MHQSTHLMLLLPSLLILPQKLFSQYFFALSLMLGLHWQAEICSYVPTCIHQGSVADRSVSNMSLKFLNSLYLEHPPIHIGQGLSCMSIFNSGFYPFAHSNQVDLLCQVLKPVIPVNFNKVHFITLPPPEILRSSTMTNCFAHLRSWDRDIVEKHLDLFRHSSILDYASKCDSARGFPAAETRFLGVRICSYISLYFVGW